MEYLSYTGKLVAFLSTIFLLIHKTDAVEILYWSSLNVTDNQPLIYFIKEDPNTWINAVKTGSSVDPEILRGNAAETHRFGPLATSAPTKSIFWSNELKRQIQTIDGIADGRSSVTSYTVPTSGQVNGIAVDWINNNVYSTDALYNWIFMTKVSGNRLYVNILIDTDLESPHGIAVHPASSYLFWTDSAAARIERSSLSGADRRVIADNGLSRPTVLTLDYPNNLLYWVDVADNKIYSSNLDGGNPKVFSAGSVVSGFTGIALYSNYIMALSNITNRLYIYDVDDGNTFYSTIASSEANDPMYGLSMMSSQQQPTVSTPCDISPCAPDDMCVSMNMNSEAECVCSHGYGKAHALANCERKHYGVIPPSFVFNADQMYYVRIQDANELESLQPDALVKARSPTDPVLFMHAEGEYSNIYIPESTRLAVATLEESGGTLINFVRGEFNVTGMAGDHLHGNIYWLDGSLKGIYVARYDGKYPTLVVKGLTGYPRALEVDHVGRKLYWSEETGASSSRIRRANLDGSGITTFISSGIGIVGQLAIDYKKERLFWSDIIASKIELVSLSGTGRKTAINGDVGSAIFGVAIFEDFVAWTDMGGASTAGVHWAVIDTQEKVNHHQDTSYTLLGGVKPGYIITYDMYADKFPSTDGCTVNNGGCDHLCLAGSTQQQRICQCPLGHQLASDGTSCASDVLVDDNFLILATSVEPHLYQISLSEPTSSAAVAEIQTDPGLNPIAIDYDFGSKQIFWSDVLEKKILRSSLNGGPTITVKHLLPTSVADGLALDLAQQYIYYTDTGLNEIVRINYAGNDEKKIITTLLDEPRGIQLRIGERDMYWADWGKGPKIEKANMDTGADRKTLISTDVKCPNGLTIDHQEKKMFWCDCDFNKIEMADLDGTNRAVLAQEESAHYFDLTVDANYVYISDWSTPYIKRVHRQTKELESEWLHMGFNRKNGITFYKRDFSQTTVTPMSSSISPSVLSTATTMMTANTTGGDQTDERQTNTLEGSSLFIIIGCAAGGLLVIILIITIVCCILRGVCRKQEATYEDLELPNCNTDKDYDEPLPHVPFPEHHSPSAYNPGFYETLR